MARTRIGCPGPRVAPGPKGSAPGLVLERHLHLRPVGADLAVLDLEIEIRHLGDAQIAQALRGRRDRRRRSLLPRLGARADQLDDLVDALAHRFLLEKTPAARVYLGHAGRDLLVAR